MRPPDEKHVQTLVESIEQFGWDKNFPVLIDQDDHILDGRHRIEAAKRAGVAHTELVIRVDDAAEALAIAWIANERSSTERRQITELLRAIGGSIAATAGQKAKRALIEARLREHPSWSDRLIANKRGCDHKTVGVVRTELEVTGEIPQSDRLLGTDGRWLKNKNKPTTLTPSNGTAEPPPTSQRSRCAR